MKHVARTCQSLAVGHGRSELVARMGRDPVRAGRRACAAGSFDDEVSLAVNDAAVATRAEHVEQGFRDEGVTAHTAPELLVTWQREQAPTGYNLGVAHGVPGAIAMLDAAAAVAALDVRRGGGGGDGGSARARRGWPPWPTPIRTPRGGHGRAENISNGGGPDRTVVALKTSRIAEGQIGPGSGW